MASSGTILSFLRPRPWTERDWTQQELAEFYRVEAALIRSGLLVDVDRGISDEGDPWFVFCRGDNGEVIAHFARIRDQYVIASAAFSGVARGKDFALLIGELMRSYPSPLARDSRQAQNVYLHPAAMLVALLATAFIVSSDQDGHDHQASHSLTRDAIRLISLGEVAILSAVAIATTWVEQQINSGLLFLENEHTSDANDHGAKQDGHADSELTTAISSLFKIDSDFGGHKTGIEATPGFSPATQHQAETTSPVQLHNWASPNLQPTFTEVSVVPSTVAASSHATSSLAVPDGMSWVQSLLVEPVLTSGSSQPDHSDHSTVSQTLTAATQISSSSTSTNAYHALAADLGTNNVNIPVVSVGNFSLETSLQKVLINLQSANGSQQTGEGQSNTFKLPVSDGPSTIAAPAFDAHADAMLQQFLLNTPNFEEDLAGQHVILVDKNPADIANSHFGSLSWTFADGSTLTIVGILPASHGLHGTG